MKSTGTWIPAPRATGETGQVNVRAVAETEGATYATA